MTSTEHTASDDNWMTLPEETCPGCSSEGNRRVLVGLTCPRFKQDGQIMACIGCGNAAIFECQAPDEDGDLLEDGCGWWFQYPLHPEASGYSNMGAAPTWNYARYQL